MYSDTIAAVATAMTNSGIGIIRISGEDAICAADRVIRLKEKNTTLSDCPTHTIHYGFVMDGASVVDEVIVLLMKAPRSYTRENTVEIDCHGGTLVINRILELLLKNGVRAAEPGEFTKRAFLNGRIDLAQAESVIDIINAKNDFALKASVDQLRGSVSGVIEDMREKLIFEASLIESAIDDPEHYQLEAYGEVLQERLKLLLEEMEQLLKNTERGLLLKEGIRTVIVGRPNSGKSSLLNSLAGKERAIVTDVAGTTRDAIEEQIRLRGITLHVIDTAGIRPTDDIVEKIGVDKAKECIETSDLVLYVVDASRPLHSEDEEIIALINGRNVIALLNKSDLKPVITEEEMKKNKNWTTLSVSAKYGEGIEALEQTIEEMFLGGEISVNDEVFLTNARQKAFLYEAKESLQFVMQSILDGMTEDFYSSDLMHAYESLGKIIGASVEDDLVNEIFSKFCMGK